LKVDPPTSASRNEITLAQVNEGTGAGDSTEEPGLGNPSSKELDHISGSWTFGPESTQGSRCRDLMPPRTLELTMFERLEIMYGPEIKRMLTVQYRYVDVLTPRATLVISIG